jgi:hypothetical protein
MLLTLHFRARVRINSQEDDVTDNKRQWVAPEIKRFGSFESATQTCIKALGSSDGFTFQGNTVPIHWCAS